MFAFKRQVVLCLLAVLIAMAFVLVLWGLFANASVEGSADNPERLEATDTPYEETVLNRPALDAYYAEHPAKEGVNGGLMDVLWNVSGSVTEIDKTRAYATIDLDESSGWAEYLNGSIKIDLTEENENNISVGDKVELSFLPPGYKATRLSHYDLTVVSKAQ